MDPQSELRIRNEIAHAVRSLLAEQQKANMYLDVIAQGVLVGVVASTGGPDPRKTVEALAQSLEEIRGREGEVRDGPAA